MTPIMSIGLPLKWLLTEARKDDGDGEFHGYVLRSAIFHRDLYRDT